MIMTIIVEIETAIGRAANGGPRINRIHCVEHTVRVACDTYISQPVARAEVLASELTWTAL